MSLKSPRPAGPERLDRSFRLFQPRVESLEDRSVPATLLATSSDLLAAANAPVTLLGASDDGNYVLLQSTATNIVNGQNDVPGTVDLFWLDQTTGTRKLITAQDPRTGIDTFAKGTKAIGAEVSVPGQLMNALISADGKSVAFMSGANAQRLNSTLGVATDDGGADAYHWASGTGLVTLISRDKAGFALGSFASVSNPGINNDGGTVSFVSDAVLYDNYDTKYKAGEDQGVVDRGPFGPNLFATLVGQVPRPVTYFYSNINSLTGKQGDFYVPFSDVNVDPLGRYISGEGLSFATINDNRHDGFFGQVLGSDIYRFTFAGVGLNPSGTLEFTPMTFLANGFSLLGLDGAGTVVNAVIARDRADVVVYSATVNTPLGLVTGYQKQNSDGTEVYRSQFAAGGVTTELITVAAGTTAAGQNGNLDFAPGAFNVTPDGRHVVFTSTATNLVVGLTDLNKAFDVFQRDAQDDVSFGISVLAGNPNRTGLGESRFPSQTTDGLTIAFESTAENLTDISDTNGVRDVFVRDRVRRSTNIASVVPGNFNSANGASTGAIATGGLRGGRVYFTSAATDIDRDFTVTGDATTYVARTPIAITDVARILGFSGGTSGSVALGALDLDGNIVPASKFQPFPNFGGEIRVATGDVNNDGVLDLVVSAGAGGGPRVLVIDGFNGRTLFDRFVYEASFTGGVYVGAADLNGDGKAEVLVGAGEGGGPRVRAIELATGTTLFDRFAYESTARTGVRVASTDFNGDGNVDIVVAAGVGGGPRVRVFDGTTLANAAPTTLADFFAFESSQRGGVYVSAGDFNLDGKGDLAVGGGPGGGPRVSVFDAAVLQSPNPNKPLKFLDFFPFAEDERDGARVALKDIDGDQFADLVVGTGGGFPLVKTYAGGTTGSPNTPLPLQTFVPFNETFGTFGAWVG